MEDKVNEGGPGEERIPKLVEDDVPADVPAVASPVRYLTVDDIVNADDIREEDVPVPEWGGVVKIRSLTAAEIGEFVDLQTGKKRDENTVRVLMLSAVNPDGTKMFPAGKAGEILVEKLRHKNMRAFMRVQHRALVINGFVEDEAAVKND